MNKDCKVSIERDANGSLKMQLTGHKDDIRILWTMLAAGPAIEDLMAKENGITVDMSALGRFAKGGGDAQ